MSLWRVDDCNAADVIALIAPEIAGGGLTLECRYNQVADLTGA